MKLEQLTPEQEIERLKFRQTWFEWGTSTAPVNKELAENAILKMYGSIGKTQKPTFIWCDSPATCLLAIEFISKLPKLSTGASLWDSLGASLGASLRDSLWASLGASLRDSLGGSVSTHINKAWWGQQEAYWIAFYLFGRDILSVKYDSKRSEQLDMWRDLAQACCWWWPYENFVFVSNRPEICEMEKFGNSERLHSLTGPALKFRDGFAIYKINGVTVPDFVIENPEKITPEVIQSERNKEVQSIMIDRYGRSRYISDSGAEIIHQDPWGILYSSPQGLFVEVINSTAEPDKTFQHFFLAVHPELRPIRKRRIVGGPQEMTALNAVASTFGLTGSRYAEGLTGDPNGTPEMAIALRRMS